MEKEIVLIENNHGHFHIAEKEGNNLKCIEPAYQHELEGIYKPLRIIDYKNKTYYGRQRKDDKVFIIEGVNWGGKDYNEKRSNLRFIDECGCSHCPGDIDIYSQLRDFEWLHKYHHGVN